MKKILIAILLLLPLAASAQLNPRGANSRSIRMVEGTFMAFIAAATDTAVDNANYKWGLNSDLGGRPIMYGINTTIACDTVTVVLALEGSVDSTAWSVVDSLSITTNHVTGYKSKTADLTLFRYPYWRLRYGLGSSNLRGNKTPTGALIPWILTNYEERF